MSYLSIQNLSASYGNIQALKNVNIEIEKGEIVTIIGANGAGKTTLLSCISGLMPHKGIITFDGQEIATKHVSSDQIVKKGIVQVPEGRQIFSELTVLENVLLPTMKRSFVRSAAALTVPACRARARELLGRVGLAGRMNHLPGELSGGEQQRVALARALVSRPGMVLADEPTGNLDAMTGAEVLRMLQELSQGSSVALVMVTHSPGAAAVCDRVLKLEDGVLVPA